MVDDVFISGTIDYNREDDCLGGCTYEENKIVPAVAKQSTTNFNMLLCNFLIKARETYEMTFRIFSNINTAESIRLKIVIIVTSLSYMSVYFCWYGYETNFSQNISKSVLIKT